MSFDVIAAYKALAAEGFKFIALQKGKKWEFSDEPKNKGEYCYRPELTRKFATSNVEEFISKFPIPEYNYGAVIPKGWVVTEEDIKNGGNINAWIDSLGPLPAFYGQRSISGGLHCFGKTSVNLVGKAYLGEGKGIELLGEGSIIVLAPSWIKPEDGKERHYTQRSNYSGSFNANESASFSADWNLEIREAFRARDDKKANQLAMFEHRKVFNIGLPQATEECQKNYLSKVEKAIEERVTSAVKGERFETLRASAVDVGQLVDYLDVNEKALWLEGLTNDWPNQNKRQKLIASGIEWGISHKKDLSYLVDYTGASKVNRLIELHENNIKVYSWAKNFVVKDGVKVKGVRVRALYQAFINQQKKVHKSRFNFSQPQMALALGLKDRKNIRKALNVLINDLKVVRKVEIEKPVGESSLPDWMLAQTFELTEVALEGEASVQSNDDYFNRLLSVGFFKRGVMPQSSELVLRSLSIKPATTTELIGLTGLSKVSVIALVKACVKAGLVVQGERGKGYNLVENFVDVCEAIIKAHDLDGITKARLALYKQGLETVRKEFSEIKQVSQEMMAWIHKKAVKPVVYATAEELEQAEQAELVLIEQ